MLLKVAYQLGRVEETSSKVADVVVLLDLRNALIHKRIDEQYRTKNQKKLSVSLF